MTHLYNALLIVLLLCGPAYAVVDEGTHIVFSSMTESLLGNCYGIVFPSAGSTVGQGWSGWDFQFDPNLGTLGYTTVTTGSTTANWYIVHPGDTFDAATIAAHQFAYISPSVGGFPGTSVGTGDFYLGVSVTDTFFDPNNYGYGWVQIHNDNGVLESVDNAIAYYDSGIIVGTLTEVPEPSSFILLALASAGLLLRCRR